ncbi:hypothetical protein ACFL2H_09215 [Planctomycetota bacterium]
MNLELNLSEQQQAALAELAQSAGTDVSHFVQEVIEKQLANEVETPPLLEQDVWQRRFEALIARHQPTGHPVDDSRESIYSDRT